MLNIDTHSKLGPQSLDSDAKLQNENDNFQEISLDSLNLLKEYVRPAQGNMIHIDIGGRYRDLAPFLKRDLNIEYAAIVSTQDHFCADSDKRLESWSGQNLTEFLTALKNISNGQQISSFSIFDGVGSPYLKSHFLEPIAQLAKEHDAYILVGTPNSMCFDNTARLMLGQQADFQNETNVSNIGLMLSIDAFEEDLSSNGLHVVSRKDIISKRKKDSNSKDSPIADGNTELGNFFRYIRSNVEKNTSNISCFLRLCLVGPRKKNENSSAPILASSRPFLSVIIRTQGKRMHMLSETLLSLHGQTDRDFEVIIMGHKLDEDRMATVSRIIDEQPTGMRRKTRLVLVDKGNRTVPLNVGFAEAKGRYIAALDDDDIVFGNWVESFRTLHKLNPGRLLRSNCLVQEVSSLQINGKDALRSEKAPQQIYAKDFDFFEHFSENNTPFMSVAFPRGVFHDLGLRFDETLSTREDWDFIMRCTFLVGIESIKSTTCIYRLCRNTESSFTLHDSREWEKNYKLIQAKFNANPFLAPPGFARKIIELVEERKKLEQQIQTSVSLRIARMVPTPIRKMGRGFLYFIWKYLGVRALFMWCKRRSF